MPETTPPEIVGEVKVLFVKVCVSVVPTKAPNGFDFNVIVPDPLVIKTLFVVGFDQGHIFSLVYGEEAFQDLYIHELTHDMRHAAGFPCH